MYSRILVCAFLSSILFACSNEKKAVVNPIPEKIDYENLGRNNAPKAMLSNSANGTVILNPKHGEPGHRCEVAVGAPLNSPAPKATTNVPPPASVPVSSVQAVKQPVTPIAATAKGMNPPHGQPNHRCDIAVGAPLNSKPVNVSASKTTAAPTQPATVTAKGMNPPHGQPNHRCDIAVGAPLNSKPASAPATTPANPPQPAATTINPPTTNSGNN